MRVDYGSDVVSQTLSALQEGGRAGCESVVLWLGQIGEDRIEVREVLRPIHEAEADMFWITEEGMDELKIRLRATRTMVAAQVHTHPNRAFHSEADDRWAIIRHEGALSLVLPYFALQSSPETFSRDAMVYRLDESDRWVEVNAQEVREHLRLC